MSTPQETQAATSTQSTTLSLLDATLQEDERKTLRTELDRLKIGDKRAEQLFSALIEEASKQGGKVGKSLTKTIQALVKGIDAALSTQLAEIMHHEKFRALEGSWRGLRHLVFESETSTTLKIKVLNAPKRDVYKDLDTAIEFDQSMLHKKVYESEFGMYGGTPFGALLGDYSFKNHPEDIDLLRKMSGIAAGAMCPFISNASHELFGLESFTELSKPRDLARIFDSVEFAEWRSFRESEDARYVAMVLPRVLARVPYGQATKKIDEFDYEEFPIDPRTGKTPPADHDHYCWMNASWVYGTRLTAAFARTNWCTAIRGKENGGMVENLPMHFFQSDSGDTVMKTPTEIAITERRDAELSRLGFIPLCHYKETNYAVFFGGQTIQKPKQYVSPKDNANSEISAKLPYIFASARIGHYLKMIARDRVGSFMERSDCEDWLQQWISQYVMSDEKASGDKKAQFPLAEAKISVTEIPGKPGYYNAQVLMRPWLQMEELNAALSMVAEIPAK